MQVMSILIISLLCESIWETSKMVWQDGKLSVDKIGAMIIGLVIAVGTGVDLFALLNIPTNVPFLGMIFTGILISRGANFIHDILVSVSNLQQK